MITLEQVLNSHREYIRTAELYTRALASGRQAVAWSVETEKKHNEYLSNVRQYDRFHPAIQVGKDIGA
jgi:hypothetical protein